MRMLTEKERRAFVGDIVDGYFSIDDPESETERELIRLGRGRWTANRYGIFELMPTEMGEKALRIDALIRQWGFGS
jgi:hypothetical protein